jgi:hypothetical protein
VRSCPQLIQFGIFSDLLSSSLVLSSLLPKKVPHATAQLLS